jgi:hypothetical protein
MMFPVHSQSSIDGNHAFNNIKICYGVKISQEKAKVSFMCSLLHLISIGFPIGVTKDILLA